MKGSQIALWEFADAPDQLRKLVPLAPVGGWLAFIYPGSAVELEAFLTDRFNSHGLSLARYQLGDGGIILAGQHLPHLAPNRPAPQPAEVE